MSSIWEMWDYIVRNEPCGLTITRGVAMLDQGWDQWSEGDGLEMMP